MIAKKKVDGGQGAAVVGLDAGDHLVFGMIAKKKVDGGQVDDEIVMIEMMELWWNRLKNNLKLWRVAGYASSFLYTWFYTYVCMKQKTNF